MKDKFTGEEDPEITIVPLEGKRKVVMKISSYKGWGFSDGHFYVDLCEEDLRLRRKGQDGDFTSNAYEETQGRTESVLGVPRAQSNNLTVMVEAGVALFDKEFGDKTHELVVRCNRCAEDARITGEFDVFCESCKEFLFA